MRSGIAALSLDGGSPVFWLFGNRELPSPCGGGTTLASPVIASGKKKLCSAGRHRKLLRPFCCWLFCCYCRFAHHYSLLSASFLQLFCSLFRSIFVCSVYSLFCSLLPIGFDTCGSITPLLDLGAYCFLCRHFHSNCRVGFTNVKILSAGLPTGVNAFNLLSPAAATILFHNVCVVFNNLLECTRLCIHRL